MRLFMSFLLAALVPAVLFGFDFFLDERKYNSESKFILQSTFGWFTIAFVISCGFVFVFAFPAYLYLKKNNLLQLWSTLLGGFLLGAMPFALVMWPPNMSGTASNSVYTIINGVVTMESKGVYTIINGDPTMAGWIQYINYIFLFGLSGFLGALVFWLVAPNKAKQAGTQ